MSPNPPNFSHFHTQHSWRFQIHQGNHYYLTGIGSQTPRREGNEEGDGTLRTQNTHKKTIQITSLCVLYGHHGRLCPTPKILSDEGLKERAGVVPRV